MDTRPVRGLRPDGTEVDAIEVRHGRAVFYVGVEWAEALTRETGWASSPQAIRLELVW